MEDNLSERMQAAMTRVKGEDSEAIRREQLSAESARQAQIRQLDPVQASARRGITGGVDTTPETTIPEKAPEETYPALRTETFMGTTRPVVEVDYSDKGWGLPVLKSVPGLDIQTATAARVFVDSPEQVTPNVNLQDLKYLQLDTPQGKQNLMDAKGVYNKQGQFLSFKNAPDYMTRVDMANRFLSTAIVDGDGRTVPLDWERHLLELQMIPETEVTIMNREEMLDESQDRTYRRIRLNEMTEEEMDAFVNKKMLLSLNMLDQEKAKPIYARVLAKRLRSIGYDDPRQIASIIKYAQSSTGMGDLEKIGVAGVEGTFRLPIELGGWLVGETVDTVSEVLTLSLAEEDEDSPWDIRSSARRGEILNNVWPRAVHTFQARMAQKGVDVPLHVAEEYMNTFTGLAPRVAKIGAELLPVSKVLAARNALKSTKEFDLFQDFLEKRVADGDTIDVKEALDEFVALRPNLKYDKTGKIVVPDMDNPKARTLWQKIYYSPSKRRLTQGFENAEAALPPAQRSQVQAAESYLERLQASKKGIISRRNKGAQRSGDIEQLERVNIDIKRQIAEIDILKARTAKPQWLRSWARSDAFMVAGMSTVGHYFQMRDDDPSSLGSTYFGELIGLGAGVAADIFMTVKNPAYHAVMQGRFGRGIYSGLDFVTKGAFDGKEAYRRFLVKHISRYSPELQQGIMARGDYVSKAFDPLIAAGMPEKDIALSYAQITNLAGLQSLEDLVRAQISTGEIASNPKQLERLQSIVTAKTRMVESLRSTLMRRDDRITSEDGSVDDFYRLINIAITQGQQSLDELNEAVRVLGKDGLMVIKDDMAKGVPHYQADSIGDGARADVETAVNVLQEANLMQSGLPTREWELLADKVTNEVAKAVKEMSDKVRLELGDIEKSRIKLKEFRDSESPNGIIAQGATEPVSIGGASTTGEQFAILMEAAHGGQKAKAKLLYHKLGTEDKPVQFYTGDGQPIAEGAATVRIDDLFDSLFFIEEAGQIKSRQAAGDKLGAKAAIQATFSEVAEPFFIGQAKDGETKDDVVRRLKEYFESEEGGQKVFRRGENVEAQVITFLRDAVDKSDAVSFMSMSFPQLRELERAFRNARDNSVGVEQARLNKSLKIIESKFSEFKIMDESGEMVDFGALHIREMDENNIPRYIPAREVLSAANKGWTSYKSRWYDKTVNNPVPGWMGWGKRQVAEQDNSAAPLRLTYPTDPKEWLKVSEIVKLDDEAGMVYVRSLANALGQRTYIPATGEYEYVFRAGEPVTDTFASILQASAGQYLLNQGTNLVPRDALNELTKLEGMFQYVDDAGNLVPMIDARKVIDDTIGWSEKTIGRQKIDDIMSKTISDLDSETASLVNNATQKLGVKRDAIRWLQSYTGKELKSDQIADALVSGGSMVLSELRKEIRSKLPANFTDDYVNGIMAEVYLDSVMRKVFPDTGRKELSGPKLDHITQVHATDVDAFNTMMGVGNPAKQKIIKELIGPERYQIWESAGQILNTMEPSSFARVAITGIPRAMSLESFASRLYAWQRQAIGFRWLSTEALIQAGRMKNYNVLAAAMTDPEFGAMFLEMARTGKPFSPEREVRFRDLMLRSMGMWSADLQVISDEKRVKLKDGREAVLNPGANLPQTDMDRLMRDRFGMVPNITVTLDDLPENRQQPYRDEIQSQE